MSTEVSKTYSDYGRPLWRRVLFTREMAIIALLIGVLVVASIQLPRFPTTITVTNLLLDVTPILLISLTMAPIMITGDIDLSVGSMVGLSSVVVGLLTHAGLSIPVAGLVAIMVGAVGGLVNGLLVTRFGLPALAVTIGDARSVPRNGHRSARHHGDHQLRPHLVEAGEVEDRRDGHPDGDDPVSRAAGDLRRHSPLHHFRPWHLCDRPQQGRGRVLGHQRHPYACDPVILSGAMSALAGVFYTLRYTSSRGDNATGLELAVIAAVVLGGVSVFGGRGALHGVVAGVLLIGALSNALRLASVTSDVINIITGVLLVLSVIAGSFMQWVQSRRIRPVAATASS